MRAGLIALALSLACFGVASAYVADTDSTHALPEPGTLSLLATGVAVGAASFLRRRRK